MKTNLVAHFVVIRVYSKMGGDLLWSKVWDNLPWAVRIKWNWYFKYRAALAQVKHPRAHVEFVWGHKEPEQRTKENLLQLRKAALMGRIAGYKVNLQKARDNWSELFPIEDDPYYQKAAAKISRLENELKQL